PLGGPLVGQVEGDVGGHDPDDRDCRDVEALGDEARADEHVEAPVAEGVDDLRRRAAPLDDIPVEAADPEPRESLPDLALEPLGPAAEEPDARGAAVGAAGGE